MGVPEKGDAISELTGDLSRDEEQGVAKFYLQSQQIFSSNRFPFPGNAHPNLFDTEETEAWLGHDPLVGSIDPIYLYPLKSASRLVLEH
jgi:hypothetical protein